MNIKMNYEGWIIIRSKQKQPKPKCRQGIDVGIEINADIVIDLYANFIICIHKE